MNDREGQTPPILSEKHHDAPSAFTPESLLREARRQKGADAVEVPKVCLSTSTETGPPIGVEKGL
ncbi:hypothetical protein [Paracoccus jiaweipingae]|uniref:hypothetical protein n=1 Tax=unclassified Paracoccus (in: a-proteobacteria) TaxID=2688777 RepID=UPI0037B38A72